MSPRNLLQTWRFASKMHLSVSATCREGAKMNLGDHSDAAILKLLTSKQASVHKLEAEVGAVRAVQLRRSFVQHNMAASNVPGSLTALPHGGFDTGEFYGSILGTNCEAVIGYVPVPVGVVGPLLLDELSFHVPLATTEGALVASVNRGCLAIRQSGGANSVIFSNGMTRAPLLRVSSIKQAADVKSWCENPVNKTLLMEAFNSTTRFGKLLGVKVHVAGRNVYVRFSCFTGDAMGMNMVTKGAVAALEVLAKVFPNAVVVSMSGNVCADKKPSAINWIEGRGRSIACEVLLPHAVIQQTLHTTAKALADLNVSKNLVGSALAGSVGGYNAHASNIVSALFLATGNDIAQNVESSTCMTLMEEVPEGVHMSVTMPSVEVGTVGGGTTLPAQAACLGMIGCRGANKAQPGANADRLARVVAGTVLAGELSLMAALASGDLLKSHLALNRKPGAAAH